MSGSADFSRFTDRARRVVVLAQEEAASFNHAYIGTEHILLGLLSEGGGVAARALRFMEVDVDEVRVLVKEIIGVGDSPPSGHIPFTPRSKKVLDLSLREALQLGHNYIGTEHVLLGLVRQCAQDAEGVASVLFAQMDISLDAIRRAVIEVIDPPKTPEQPESKKSESTSGEPLRQAASELLLRQLKGPNPDVDVILAALKVWMSA